MQKSMMDIKKWKTLMAEALDILNKSCKEICESCQHWKDNKCHADFCNVVKTLTEIDWSKVTFNISFDTAALGPDFIW